MRTAPTPLQTLLVVMRGNLPRLRQGRALTLALIALFPALAATVAILLIRQQGHDIPPTGGIQVFHGVYVHFVLPVLALMAAPAGIREDLEQRTLPLALVRPAQAWMMPGAKGLLWYAWSALWLLVATAFLPLMGVDPAAVPALAAALLLAHWAHLGFMSLLVQRFRRGLLWGALFLFVWDPLVRIMPSNVQRLTFLHHLEAVAGSRGGGMNKLSLLSQEAIVTPEWIAALVLITAGVAAWAYCGWHLQRTPVGLSGREAEG